MSLFLSGFLLKGLQRLDCQSQICLFAADNKGINYFHIETELLLSLITLGLRLLCFTYSIENFWSNLKAKLKVMRGSQRKMLDGHLDEFVYRYNRKTEGSMSELMLTDISRFYPV